MHGTSAPVRLEADAWRRRLAALLLVGSTAWAVLLWWAPPALAAATARGRTNVLPRAVYVVGRAVCHQRPLRSFTVAGVPQPVCARCAGLYLGAPLGVACAVGLARRYGRRRVAQVSLRGARRIIAWVVAPTLASVVVEWSQVAQPGNGLRLLLAVPAGAAVGWLTAAALLRQVDERLG